MHFFKELYEHGIFSDEAPADIVKNWLRNKETLYFLKVEGDLLTIVKSFY